MKSKSLWEGSHEYRINGVRYVVDSCFCSSKKKENYRIAYRLERLITSDIAPLTVDGESDIMEEEYVCSVAGKEELCNRTEN